MKRCGNFSTVQVVPVSETGSLFRKRTRGNVRTGYSHVTWYVCGIPALEPGTRPQPPEHEIFTAEPQRKLFKCSRRLNEGARYDAGSGHLLGMHRCTDAPRLCSRKVGRNIYAIWSPLLYLNIAQYSTISPLNQLVCFGGARFLGSYSQKTADGINLARNETISANQNDCSSVSLPAVYDSKRYTVYNLYCWRSLLPYSFGNKTLAAVWRV